MGDENVSLTFETTRNEQVRLLIVSQCFLQVFRNNLQKRKEPPKCASVKGMAALLTKSEHERLKRFWNIYSSAKYSLDGRACVFRSHIVENRRYVYEQSCPLSARTVSAFPNSTSSMPRRVYASSISVLSSSDKAAKLMNLAAVRASSSYMKCLW